MAMAVVGFFGFIVWKEWEKAESASQGIGVAIVTLFFFLFARALWIYRPHTTRIEESTIIGNPRWSSNVLDRTFLLVDVNSNGRQMRIRYTSKVR